MRHEVLARARASRRVPYQTHYLLLSAHLYIEEIELSCDWTGLVAWFHTT